MWLDQNCGNRCKDGDDQGARQTVESRPQNDRSDVVCNLLFERIVGSTVEAVKTYRSLFVIITYLIAVVNIFLEK